MYVELWIYWREMERYSLEQAVKQFDLKKYDLIHCHDFMTARALARSKPQHTPLIVSLHNFKYHEAKITGDLQTLRPNILRFSCIAVPGRFSRQIPR